jgi:hypothetical protein
MSSKRGACTCSTHSRGSAELPVVGYTMQVVVVAAQRMTYDWQGLACCMAQSSLLPCKIWCQSPALGQGASLEEVYNRAFGHRPTVVCVRRWPGLVHNRVAG